MVAGQALYDTKEVRLVGIGDEEVRRKSWDGWMNDGLALRGTWRTVMGFIGLLF